MALEAHADAHKACCVQVAAKYGIVKVADFGLSRVTTLLRTGLGQTSFAGSRSLQQSFNEVRRSANSLCGPGCGVWSPRQRHLGSPGGRLRVGLSMCTSC